MFVSEDKWKIIKNAYCERISKPTLKTLANEFKIPQSTIGMRIKRDKEKGIDWDYERKHFNLKVLHVEQIASAESEATNIQKIKDRHVNIFQTIEGATINELFPVNKQTNKREKNYNYDRDFLHALNKAANTLSVCIKGEREVLGLDIQKIEVTNTFDEMMREYRRDQEVNIVDIKILNQTFMIDSDKDDKNTITAGNQSPVIDIDNNSDSGNKYIECEVKNGN